MLSKLDSSDRKEQDYVFRWFIDYVMGIDRPNRWLKRIFKQALKKGDVRFYEAMASYLAPPGVWGEDFKELFDNFVESEVEEEGTDIPF